MPSFVIQSRVNPKHIQPNGGHVSLKRGSFIIVTANYTGDSVVRKMVRVNMSTLTTRIEDIPEKYQTLGGRSMTSIMVAIMVADKVPPHCHPLGVHNKGVFAPGIVTGTSAPSSGRISVGGKSPLTGG